MAGKNKHQRTPIGLFMELGLYGETWVKGKAGAWVCGIDLADGEDYSAVVRSTVEAPNPLDPDRPITHRITTEAIEPLRIQRLGSTPTDAIKALHRAWKAHEAHVAKEIDEEAQANEARAEHADQAGEP